MENLATISDVEKRLGLSLAEDEIVRVEGLLEEASVLVEGYLGTVPDPVPRGVRVVASRMVARVLQSPTDGFAVESESVTAGPFSQNRKFTAGASGGAPWLTAMDKMALRKVAGRGGIYTIGIG